MPKGLVYGRLNYTPPQQIEYSVLLLYPDYCSDSFGRDTYFAHVTAANPAEALKLSRKKLMSEALAPEIDEPDDIYCLLIIQGHKNDLTSEANQQE